MLSIILFCRYLRALEKKTETNEAKAEKGKAQEKYLIKVNSKSVCFITLFIQRVSLHFA